MKEKHHTFHQIASCIMCRATAESFRIIVKRLNSSQDLFPSRENGVCVSFVKCRKCGLGFSIPQPAQGKIDDHYDMDPFQYWKKSHFKTDPKYFTEDIKCLKRRQQNDLGFERKSLDIGVGP